MKVLWVTPSLPHPQGTGGCVLEYEMISALSAWHDIHVVTAAVEGPLTADPLETVASSFTRVRWQSHAYPMGRVSKTRAMVVARPDLHTWIKRDRLEVLAEAMRRVDAAAQVDVAVVVLGEIAPLVHALDRPTGLFLFDSLTREIERQLELRPPVLRRIQRQVERRRMLRYEREWYRRADRLAAVSNVDAAWFRAEVGRPVDVIENSIPDAWFRPADRTPIPGLVTFVGTLDHPPNADAIGWLISDIWPRVQRARPDARLRIVGRADPSGSIAEWVQSSVHRIGGEVHLDVEDVRPHYWESTATVAPIRLGAGMRTKVIQALACGRPVVATPTALEGLDPRLASAVATGTTSAELAEQLVRVLDGVDPAAGAGSIAEPLESLRSGNVAERLDRWLRAVAATASES